MSTPINVLLVDDHAVVQDAQDPSVRRRARGVGEGHDDVLVALEDEVAALLVPHPEPIGGRVVGGGEVRPEPDPSTVGEGQVRRQER